ncbi:MAG: Stp1/IreP family PP2C-type Ser/Thr phosphatase, partial [Acidimicrobiales bacterium]|nr:Stp1/IreP family PP2C-type Ser/Thr phosphatase [Acidimicrobiales bacterium]
MTLLRSGSATDTGLVRSVNQDLAVEFPNLYAVADGMGGHAGGEVAARLAVDTLSASFGRQPTGAGLSEAVVEANEVVWEHSLEHPELRGMGTTLAAVALVNEDGHDLLALVNVGDSRVYRFHEGELSQITTDHSLAEEMVKSGELTSEEAAVHPHRHILTRALGVSADVTVDVWRIQPARGDRFLLCSDGLTNELEESEIGQVLGSVSDPREASDVLVRAARTHGGSDNITVVVVDVVVGETEDDAVPAVAAVAPDFRMTPVESNGAAVAVADLETEADAEPAEEEPPSRRERRKAKRRARRVARGRRLITLRTLIFVILLAAVVVGGFLWYHPVAKDRTGVTTADVPS